MHLYVHVPFCARRCSYCDFAIAVRREVPSARYVEATLTEWARRRGEPPVADWPALRSLYFGGGTPSRLAPDAMARLIDRLTADVPLAPGAEVTIEVNPDDVTMPAVLAWRGAGINRVSLGIQSHDPTVLAWMHRTHRAEQVPDAVAMLREGGFDNISFDLIFALPAELSRDWTDDLERTLALGPDHLSLYGLTVEPTTPLGRWTARGEVVPASDDRYATEYLAAHRAVTDAGFEHYEVSNAARPGRRAVHNAAYWAGVDFLGLGPGAHSFLAGTRSWNLRDWAAWEAALRGGRDAREAAETLTAAQHRLEDRYLGLRTAAGMAARDLPPAQVASWVAAGWAERAGDRIRLTVEGWLRLDALVAGVEGS
jgi:oxygen-independent coproporphyrinogen-3 oxidase